MDPFFLSANQLADGSAKGNLRIIIFLYSVDCYTQYFNSFFCPRIKTNLYCGNYHHVVEILKKSHERIIE